MDKLDYTTALDKLQHYCAYQERCHSEVRAKLISIGSYGFELEHIIADLIEGTYLNEQRYACLYVRSKFRQKGWGRYKIQRSMETKRVSKYCIRYALDQEIGADDYEERLCALIEKKARTVRDSNLFTKRRKVATYVIGKGYEADLVWEWTKNLLV
jgi:regulatory protein